MNPDTNRTRKVYSARRPELRLLTILIGIGLLLLTLKGSTDGQNSLASANLASATSKLPPAVFLQSPQPYSQADANRISDINQTVSTVEWLGPLAPIAVSPFFGITCLSGMSMFSEGMPWEGNAFISDNQVLRSPAVFGVFLILTLLTSLPRLTKVSKPLAQALDQLEAFSGIITLIVLRVAAASVEPASEHETLVHVGGIVSLSYDMLMVVAMIINIIVINTIKFFFEVLVWMVPFPFVDAILEALNKLICAALMIVYAFSPLAATIFNLIIFVVCAIAFRWVYRRVTYARRILTDPIIAIVFPGYSRLGRELLVFPRHQLGPFAAKSKLWLSKTDTGWLLRKKRLIKRPLQLEISSNESRPELIVGLLINRIKFESHESSPLIFSRRHNQHLELLMEQFQLHRKHSEVAPRQTPLELA